MKDILRLVIEINDNNTDDVITELRLLADAFTNMKNGNKHFRYNLDPDSGLGAVFSMLEYENDDARKYSNANIILRKDIYDNFVDITCTDVMLDALSSSEKMINYFREELSVLSALSVI